MFTKLRAELERVAKDKKQAQREVDKLEYDLEENEKDLKNSKDQIQKESIEKEKLQEEHERLKVDVESFASLKQEKRERQSRAAMTRHQICPIAPSMGRIRTPDPLIRSQVLYPAELPARGQTGCSRRQKALQPGFSRKTKPRGISYSAAASRSMISFGRVM